MTNKIKILIIGNSHVAILMQAFQAIQSPPFKIDFLTSGGRFLAENMKISDGIVTLTTPENMPTIFMPEELILRGYLNLYDYEHIFIYGFQLPTSGTGEGWIKVLKASKNCYSEALWNEYSKDLVHRTDHYKILKSITGTDLVNRIISLPGPLPNILSSNLLGLSLTLNEKMRKVIASEKVEIMKLGFEFYSLPKLLLHKSEYATAEEYKNENPEDYCHLNAEGGKIVLNHIIEIIKNKL